MKNKTWHHHDTQRTNENRIVISLGRDGMLAKITVNVGVIDGTHVKVAFESEAHESAAPRFESAEAHRLMAMMFDTMGEFTLDARRSGDDEELHISEPILVTRSKVETFGVDALFAVAPFFDGVDVVEIYQSA